MISKDLRPFDDKFVHNTVRKTNVSQYLVNKIHVTMAHSVVCTVEKTPSFIYIRY